ncbi:Protein of unknown function [Microbacterium sp. cf046]|uniref:DUF3027 domain-containing protein n=1 Tax=Microbacterium sp. cf046 TaxID=1761803 RepID=UPI0008EAAC84|nr:DUF3027 domain-containing protein [Microbacterium sp. cf046]SFS17372.1 Protein of unknown function [Microbacterium sp. cf046]
MTSTPEIDPTAETESPLETEPTADAEGVETETAETAAAASEPIDPSVARELALAALREITPASTIGDPTDSAVDADGVLTLRFANRMPGYPGWFWTVSLAQVPDAAPTVLEVELTPGEGSLTAPDWLPWAERLAEYQAAQAALAAEGLATDDLGLGDDDEDDDLDDVDDLDASDFDDDGSPILHSGDVDGVDIDELSDDVDDSDDEDSDDLDEDEESDEDADEGSEDDEESDDEASDDDEESEDEESEDEDPDEDADEGSEDDEESDDEASDDDEESEDEESEDEDPDEAHAPES